MVAGKMFLAARSKSKYPNQGRRTKRTYKYRKSKPLVNQVGHKGLNCNPRVNRASRSLTNKAPSNNRTGNSVVQNKYYVTLTTFDQSGLSFGSADYANNVYNTNSFFKPIFSSSNQPRGYDQLTQLYRGYHVYAMAYDITLFTKDTTKEGFKVGVTASYDNKTTWTNAREMEEYTNFPVTWTTLSTDQTVSRLKGIIQCCDAQQVTKSDYANDDDFKAGVGASPNIIPRLHVIGYTLDGSTSTQGVEINIQLMQFGRFENPLALSSS